MDQIELSGAKIRVVLVSHHCEEKFICSGSRDQRKVAALENIMPKGLVHEERFGLEETEVLVNRNFNMFAQRYPIFEGSPLPNVVFVGKVLDVFHDHIRDHRLSTFGSIDCSDSVWEVSLSQAYNSQKGISVGPS